MSELIDSPVNGAVAHARAKSAKLRQRVVPSHVFSGTGAECPMVQLPGPKRYSTSDTT